MGCRRVEADMKIEKTDLPGLLIIEPRAFEDERGFFTETYNEARWHALGLPTRWVQDNRSRSRRGVLRGLHFQAGSPQGKLVSVVYGEVYDVALDVRRGSPTFGTWYAAVLGDSPPKALWLPPGFAHGLLALSDVAEVSYKCDTLYDSSSDRGVRWDDPALGIPWPERAPILSAKDRALPLLEELVTMRDVLPAYDLTKADSFVAGAPLDMPSQGSG